MILRFLNKVFDLLKINKIPEFCCKLNKYKDEIVSSTEIMCLNKIDIKEHEIKELKQTIEDLCKENNELKCTHDYRVHKILEIYEMKNDEYVNATFDTKPQKTEFVKHSMVFDRRVYETVMFYKGKKIKINWFFKDGLNVMYDVLDYEQKIIDEVFHSFHEKIQILMKRS